MIDGKLHIKWPLLGDTMPVVCVADVMSKMADVMATKLSQQVSCFINFTGVSQMLQMEWPLMYGYLFQFDFWGVKQNLIPYMW